MTPTTRSTALKYLNWMANGLALVWLPTFIGAVYCGVQTDMAGPTREGFEWGAIFWYFQLGLGAANVALALVGAGMALLVARSLGRGLGYAFVTWNIMMWLPFVNLLWLARLAKEAQRATEPESAVPVERRPETNRNVSNVGAIIAGAWLGLGILGCVGSRLVDQEVGATASYITLPLFAGGVSAVVGAALSRNNAEKQAVIVPIGCGCSGLFVGSAAMAFFYFVLWPSM